MPRWQPGPGSLSVIKEAKPNPQSCRHSIFQKILIIRKKEAFLSKLSTPLKVGNSHQKTQGLYFLETLGIHSYLSSWTNATQKPKY